MRTFIGEAGLNGGQVYHNKYDFATDRDKKPVVLLRGTFTAGELLALYDAIMMDNQASFKFPGE